MGDPIVEVVEPEPLYTLSVEQGPIVRALETMLDMFGPDRTKELLGTLIDSFTNVELAAIAYDWPLWARPSQLEPKGNWIVWLLLAGRGWGKSATAAPAIVDKIQNQGLRSIGMAAQVEEKTHDVNVLGLMEASPPWFKPTWNDGLSRLEWPNGAVAYAYTPEKPGNIRSKNLELAWISELQSWPRNTMDEAYSNFEFATRIGKAQMIVDCTPKAGHPIIMQLLAMSESDPVSYPATRGSMLHNYANLAPNALAKLVAKYAGTAKGREEMHGLMASKAEGALFNREWFSIREPVRLVRTVIAIDPAVTDRAGNDSTGIIVAGRDVDGQAVVLEDRTGKHAPETWAEITIDEYFAKGCDLAIVETNKGGKLLTRNLRAAASLRGITVIVVDKDWSPRHVDGVIHVREIYSRGEKADRAQPTATAYNARRVSHARPFPALEALLTTWEPKPGVRSPDRMDALVSCVDELLGLSDEQLDNAKAFDGIDRISQELNRPASQTIVTSLPSEIVALLGYGSGRGGLI